MASKLTTKTEAEHWKSEYDKYFNKYWSLSLESTPWKVHYEFRWVHRILSFGWGMLAFTWIYLILR